MEPTRDTHPSTGKIRKKIAANEQCDFWHASTECRRALGPAPTGPRSVQQERQLFVRYDFFLYFSRTRVGVRSRFHPKNRESETLAILFNFWGGLRGLRQNGLRQIWLFSGTASYWAILLNKRSRRRLVDMS